MKRLRPTLLLLCLMLFCSCLQIDQAPGTSEEGTSAATPPEHTLPTWSEALPVWSDAEAQAAAEAALHDPTGGIVDHTDAAYSHTDLQEDLQELYARYGKHFSYRTVGISTDGNSIYLAVLGNPQAKQKILISAAIHGREYMTSLLVMKQLEFYLANYTSGSYQGVPYAVLFDEFCFYILPMLNPDGVAISQKGLSGIRSPALREQLFDFFKNGDHSYKNQDLYFSHWKANANGVDLNRNFDALWESYTGAPQPGSSQFKGAFAASEPETRAVVDLVNTTDGIVASLCIHSQGEVLYWNCGQSDPDRTYKLTQVIAARNGYDIIPEQNNDASMSDWLELKKDVPAITVEIGKSPGNMVLPIEEFSPAWLANYDLLPLTAMHFVTG